MDFADVAAAAAKIEANAPHADYLKSIVRPCVDIDMVGPPTAPESSRFGGHPFVPSEFRWPQHDDGEYRFLGQINFNEIEAAPHPLPQTGLLSLFYAHDDDGEVFWGADGDIIGYFWEDHRGHAVFDSPTTVADPQRITLTAGVDIPRHWELRSAWPFAEDDLRELVALLGPPRWHLLGYPSFTSLAYDPTPGPGWVPLLTVGSLDELEWVWHDGDNLMVLVEADRLAARDFGHLKSDAG